MRKKILFLYEKKMISSEVILHVQMHFSQKNSQKVNLNPFFIFFSLPLFLPSSSYSSFYCQKESCSSFYGLCFFSRTRDSSPLVVEFIFGHTHTHTQGGGRRVKASQIQGSNTRPQSAPECSFYQRQSIFCASLHLP